MEWPRLVRAIHAPQRVDAEIVSYLQRIKSEYSTADRMVGPHPFIDAVPAQMRLIDWLRSGARGDVRGKLLTVVASYADFASWLHQDAGNARVAAYWADRAMEWAQEAGDDVWVSYVLRRKSKLARDERDAERAISLAQAAQRDPARLTPRACGVAAEQEAEGHALAGDEVACHRKFDEARELVALAERSGDLGPGRNVNEVVIELQRANAWQSWGTHSEPSTCSSASSPSCRLSGNVTMGGCCARLARAYAANRDPEQAVAVGRQALVIGREIGFCADLCRASASGRRAGRLRRSPDRLRVPRSLPAPLSCTFLHRQRYPFAPVGEGDWLVRPQAARSRDSRHLTSSRVLVPDRQVRSLPFTVILGYDRRAPPPGSASRALDLVPPDRRGTIHVRIRENMRSRHIPLDTEESNPWRRAAPIAAK
ncbi:MAG: hypothetical protein ACRDYA_03495 [Egibacteraceae bacterium]